ncbi:MAG: hypothetical protein KME19_17470 [Microcoleus vaginatus WJT46-NPBG5]|nr:hypothetical protein [Microcoleus vaginatus WJT46-NPBG5]
MLPKSGIQVNLSRPAAGVEGSQSGNCHKCRFLKRATPSRRILTDQGFAPLNGNPPSSSRPVVSSQPAEVPQDFHFNLLKLLN